MLGNLNGDAGDDFVDLAEISRCHQTVGLDTLVSEQVCLVSAALVSEQVCLVSAALASEEVCLVSAALASEQVCLVSAALASEEVCLWCLLP